MTIQAIRFNKTNLLSLIKDDQAVTVKDVEVVGLNFKVGKKRSTFQYEKRISGKAGKSGKPGKKSSSVTLTIGAFPAITIDDARQEARRIANLCEKGIDPREEKRKLQQEAETNEVILGVAIDKSFEVKKELAKKTIKTYREIVKNQFPQKWMDVNMLDISPEMIAEHFHVIHETARERCWKFLKIYGNIWNTCKPFFKNESGERILKHNPIPETRSLLTQVKKDQPKRSVVPVNLLGQFVVTAERLRSGEIQLNPENLKAPTTGLIRIYDILLLFLFTAFRWTEAQNLKWEYVNLDFGIIRLPGDAREEEGDFDGTKNHHDH